MREILQETADVPWVCQIPQASSLRCFKKNNTWTEWCRPDIHPGRHFLPVVIIPDRPGSSKDTNINVFMMGYGNTLAITSYPHCAQRQRDCSQKGGEPEGLVELDSGGGRGGVWWTWYLTPCSASRSVESFALRSCSSCSCLLSVRSSCWASTLMSLATTTAVCRSAWNRRHSSFSSYTHKHMDM